jgi:hypothetical protein
MHHFVDSVTISGTKRTSDGYLTTVAKSVRTGEQLYAGYEVGKPNIPVVRVTRPAEEVFSRDSLQSFSHAPVTLNHPSEPVTSDNWKDLAVGEVSTAALPDGTWVSLPLILKDSSAIAAVESGKRELSAGYTCDLDWTGEDTATMRNIRINHLAIVDKARAGEQARIGDGSISWGASPIHATDTEIKSMTLKTVMVDGIGSVETTDAGALAINKLIGDAARVAETHTATVAALDAKLADADAALAKAEAERDAALAKVLSDADLDKAAAARGDLIAKAKALAPNVVTDGKPALEIKKAVLAERKINLDGKSEAYVEARFDTLVEDNAGQEATRNALGNVTPAVTTDAETIASDAHARMVARMTGKEIK